MTDVLKQLDDLERIPTAEGVDRLLRALHGESVSDLRGVLHLTAVWLPKTAPSEPIVMKINSSTPRSELDFFLLNAARAWADVVLTTGKILREEPDLEFDLAGKGALALRSWRHSVEPDRLVRPELLILTSGRGLDLEHRVFDAHRRGEQRVVFVTGKQSEEQLGRRLDGSSMEVVGLDDGAARSVVEWARSRGCERLSIEAGPSSAIGLYDDPVLVDRLWLSRYQAESLSEAVWGAPFVSLSGPSTSLGARGRFSMGVEEGDWRFEQWTPNRGR